MTFLTSACPVLMSPIMSVIQRLSPDRHSSGRRRIGAERLEDIRLSISGDTEAQNMTANGRRATALVWLRLGHGDLSELQRRQHHPFEIRQTVLPVVRRLQHQRDDLGQRHRLVDSNARLEAGPANRAEALAPFARSFASASFTSIASAPTIATVDRHCNAPQRACRANCCSGTFKKYIN